MIKNYLLRIILVFAIICQFCNKASAQYAIGGTAGPNLYNSVYWLTWDPTSPGTTIISAPAGADATHVPNGPYVYQFSPTVRITAVISNEVFVGGSSPDMLPYTPGNYAGDGLDLIYSGNNVPKIFGSRGVANSGLSTAYGGQVTFDIDVKVAILINGVYRDVQYPGMVVGDAESVDAGGEYISGETPNPIAWQLINKRTEGNNADDHYKMDLSNGGRAFKLYADLPPGNFGVQAVMFAHGARSIKNVSMKGSGITAIALGFVLPFDLGDAPASYHTAGHYLDQFQITDYYPGDGTYAVVNYNTTPLLAYTDVYIGANNTDPDGQPVGTVDAKNDDTVGNADESTLNPATLPVVKVNTADDIVYSIPVTNNKSVPATLYAWIDFNNDGVFSSDEVLTATVPANTVNQTFTFTFLNSKFASKLKVGPLYSRLRLTTTTLVDNATTDEDERSFSFAADGEAEDYRLKDILGVTISGAVFSDHDGAGNGITGSPVQLVTGQQLYAYLINSSGTIINTVPISATGTYSFTGTNTGVYTVAISTNNVAIGGSLASVSANLPAIWKPSGEVYGINNAGHIGVEPGLPNLQIEVATPGTSLDITGVNFAINQVPVTNPDVGTTTINTSVDVDPLANDLDQDGGSINITSVLLIDPADNVKKTTVVLAGKGTFVLNTTTGVVTFTPITNFIGKAVVSYTVKDDYGSESLFSTITINMKPVGVPDNIVTTISTPTTTDVKANDGVSATGTTVGAATFITAHGSIVINPSGTITYTPTIGYVGVDSYTYNLITADGVVSDAITVSVLVGPGTQPVGFPDADVTTIATPVTTTVTANDPSALATSTITVFIPPAHGTAVVVAGTGKITYTPAAGYMGKDSYTYTLTNGANVSNQITVTISVKPLGVIDNVATIINTAVTTTVKANDGASAINTTVALGTVAPAHGSVVLNAGGTITYTPAAGYMGKDTYTYTLTTADGVVSDPVIVNISVKPIGAADTETTTINTAATTTVKANDGASATGTTVTAGTTPLNGTIVINADGTITYTPTTGYIGKDTYSYTLTTADGTVSDLITVSVNVRPVGVNDFDATLVNIPVTTTVKANDGASALGTTVTVGIAPSNGAIVVNASGTITYTPTASYSGTDTYTYILTTGDGVASAPITVTITVNTKPVGSPDADNTVINTAVTTTVTANDLSATGSTTTVLAQPLYGTAAVVNAAAGTVIYTPAPGYMGKDTYRYKLTVAGFDSDPITVNINVRPVGVDDADATPVNTPVTTIVKANDGASGIGTSVLAGILPAHGTILVNAGGTITYTPATGYVGPDTYTYTLNTIDGVASAPITVNITVNGKPVGTDDTDTTPLNTAVTTTVTANDANAVGSIITIIIPPVHGTATIVSATAGTIRYTPTTDYIGKDTYTYTLTVAGVVSDPIKVTINVRPVGLNDVDATIINIPVTTTVKANDGLSGIGTSVLAGASPAHGTIVVNAGGTITYTPTTGYVGPDTYTYTLNTADGVASTPITVSITVNARPIGAEDIDTTPINNAVTTTVTANDPNGIGSTIAVFTQPVNGTAAVVSATGGTIIYSPVAGYMGKDTYSYTLNNGGILSDPIKVTINVRPVGTNDVDVTTINTPVTTIVKANDGASGIGTNVLADIAPVHGSIVITAAGAITYTPTANYTGTDSYTYTLNTNDGVASTPITVTITINGKPVGADDADATAINTAVTTTVTANDPGALGSTIAISTQPAHGTAAVVSATNGTVLYTPVAGYIGKDAYMYTLTVAGVVSDPIKVIISIRPVGVNDVDATVINTPVTTTVKINDGASAIATTVLAGTAPLHGAIVVNALGTITYTPNTGYTGPDIYTYTLNTADGVASTPITVNITVNPRPVGLDDLDSTPINTAVTTTVTANDPGASGSTIAILNQPVHGTAAVVSASNGTVIYTPATDYIGKDSYTYTLTVGGIVSDPVKVNISVKPVGTPDIDKTAINVAVTTTVKANDGAISGGATITVAAGSTAPAHGTIVVNTNGTITYTPATNYLGDDTYTYTLTTPDGVVSDQILVTITVTNKPIGTNDADVTSINTTKVTTVTTNDADGAGSAIAVLNSPAHGTAIVLSATNGTITYTPATDYIGKDTYTYTLTKAGIVSDPITVTISVKPVGTPDVDKTPVNTAVTTIVKANDGAVSGGSTIAVSAGTTAPAHGSIVVNANGTITYTPVTNYVGTDTYTYTLTTPDGVVSDQILVTITVIPKPAGTNDIDFTPINTAVTTIVTANDADGTGSTITLLGTPAHGTATVVSATTGTVLYTPANNYIGKDTYTYTLTKAGIVSEQITVTINIKPVGTDDADRTPVNTSVVTTVKTNDGASAIGTNVSAGAIAPSHGSITVNANGTITYNPATGYIGTDTYTYILTTADGVVSDPVTVTVTIYSASMSLTKVANNGGTKAGDLINYTLVVTNTGNTVLTNVVITDAGADAGSITPATISTLAVGASVTITAKHTLTQADVNATQYSNQANALGVDIKGNTVPKVSDNPTTSAVNDPTVITILPAGTMSLTKTGVLLSNVVTYTFIAKNTGNTTLFSVTLTDAKLGLTNVTVPVATFGLLPGETVSYNYVYTLTAADRDLGTVTNTATVNAKDPGANTISATATAVTAVPKSPIAVDDAAQVSTNTPVIISVLKNDNNGGSISLNPATIEIITQPAHGTVVVNIDGTVTYTPATDYSGPDSFTYRVKDIFGYYTNVATVKITNFYTEKPKMVTLFTPNGDGVNDTFEIRNLGLFAQNELIIIDRWGNEVYKQTSYKNTWTGEGLSEGTYYYLLKVKSTIDGDWQVYKGFITLIRTFKK